MRTPIASLVVLLAAVALAACGGTSPGDSCDTTGYLCQDNRSALECRDGTWRALPCRGAAGCQVNNKRVECDVTRNQQGDACAKDNEGEGICDPSGAAVLECRQGTFVQTSTCATCTVAGGQVTCSQ